MDLINQTPGGHILPALRYLDLGRGRYVPRIDGYRCAHCGQRYREQCQTLVKHLRDKHGVILANREVS